MQSATDTIYQAIVAAFISRDPQITAAGHFLSCAILMFLHRKLPITVKTIRVVNPELPFFLVNCTRRLVRGFPTYRTLLEIM